MPADRDVPGTATPSDRPFDAGHRALTVGLVAVVTLVAFESLAVITILPDIEDDLGGLAWYGWVTTAFFLGTMIGIVFAGDQADRSGAGRPYAIGLALFAVGLVIGGLAPAMPVLVAGRFVQGFGAGVVPAIGYVVIGRCYAEAARARMFAVLSTAWVVPGIVGPALAERISTWFGWRWVFLGLLPLVVVAGSVVLPQMRRVGPVTDSAGGANDADGVAGADADEPVPFTRRRIFQAARVGAGVALVVAGLGASSWLTLPAVGAGVVVAVGPLRRLTPPGTLRGGHGLPAVIASRGVLTFAFFGTDTFVPFALTDGRGASTFAGSVAVTTGTLAWTAGAWSQDRWITRTGERRFVACGYGALAAGIAVVAVGALPDVVPAWVIPVGWLLGGLGIGLAYAAHSQLTLRCSPAQRYGESTASLQLLDNAGVALGTGTVGALVTWGTDAGQPEGRAVALAFLVPFAVALGGLVLARRLPAPAGAAGAVVSVDPGEHAQ